MSAELRYLSWENRKSSGRMKNRGIKITTEQALVCEERKHPQITFWMAAYASLFKIGEERKKTNKMHILHWKLLLFPS